MEPLGYRPTALFVPLRAVQQIKDPVTFSTMFSRQIWQIWLSLNAFLALEYDAKGRAFRAATRLGPCALARGPTCWWAGT